MVDKNTGDIISVQHKDTFIEGEMAGQEEYAVAVNDIELFNIVACDVKIVNLFPFADAVEAGRGKKKRFQWDTSNIEVGSAVADNFRKIE